MAENTEDVIEEILNDMITEDSIRQKLLDNKKINEASIKVYLGALEKMNKNDNKYTNLDFLTDKVEIDRIISNYKITTRRNFYVAICAILSLYPNKSELKSEYFKSLQQYNKEVQIEQKSKKEVLTTDRNWIHWNDVLSKWTELKDEVSKFAGKRKKAITEEEYNKLLEYVVLSLYTLQTPLRNAEFYMTISKGLKMDRNINYISLDYDEFIINSGVHRKVIPINSELKDIIYLYLSYHPLMDAKLLSQKKSQIDFPFLVYSSGKCVNANNGITYILNKIFNRRIGSSMLRKSYLLKDQPQEVLTVIDI